jgi:HD-GYP domain-containing protein (c-di-GMP phosphodiesterase class II)
MERRQIPVGELQFGMYVAELDRPWTETPFMFQGFHLRTDEQLEMLKRFCKHVFVDLERTERWVPEAKPLPPRSGVRGAVVYREKAPVEVEFKQASRVYIESVDSVADVLQGVQSTGTILDSQQVKESVARITDSVVRNPDAMLLVARMRQLNAATLTRALQVSIYMIVFARFLGLAREELELLGLLGLLQDVGKTRLPRTILDKAGPLTPEESDIAKKHVELSAQILGTTPGLPASLAELAMLHHERQDGTGYPRKLKGAEIGLLGSIAAIADTFDALTAVRPYAEPLSPSKALSYLYKERGVGYHAELVEQFIQCVGVFPVGSVVELNTGEQGIVISQNLVRRLKPKVMVVLDPQGHPVRPHKILDLDKDPKAGPDEPYRIRRTLEQTRLQVDPREMFL